MCLLKGVSHAQYGESAHNFNAALDLFQQQQDGKYLLNRQWFLKVVKPALESWMIWYGDRDAEFYELPHVQISTYRELVRQGKLKLVE
jgi:hypothetical protein